MRLNMSVRRLALTTALPLILLANCVQAPKESQNETAQNSAATATDAAAGVAVDMATTPSPPAPYEASPLPYVVEPPMPAPVTGERYAGVIEQAFQQVAAAPVSTFGVDVDTGSYTNVRRFLNDGQLPPVEAIRVEEMLNYFHYDYAAPKTADTPFTVISDVARTPWNPNSYLLRVALKGYEVPVDKRPPANLVFLLDVSGSMMDSDKLPLLKNALQKLTKTLRADDRVSIVTYAGWTGVALKSTLMDARGKEAVETVLDQLSSGGSTAGGDGIRLAYAQARKGFVQGAINRVILATDGDFNVGVSDTDALKRIIEAEREDGIALSTLGFGKGNYREDIMEMLADSGNGHYAYIDSAAEARKVLVREAGASLLTIAKDVKMQVEFNPKVVRAYRLIGYENRALAREDFDNDHKDAGDIGAGHTVTALYEVILVGAPQATLQKARYSDNERAAPAMNEELAYLRLRYKKPDARQSQLIETPLPAALLTVAQAPRGSFAFASAVAAFGQRLRQSENIGHFSYDDINTLALRGGSATAPEFQDMLQAARKLDTGIARPGTAPGL
jgi:Ca-activated chloride channel homolog